MAIEKYEFQVTQLNKVIYLGKLYVEANSKNEAIELVKVMDEVQIEELTVDWEQELNVMTTVEGSTEVFDGETKIV